jgi:hypothetical protein
MKGQPENIAVTGNMGGFGQKANRKESRKPVLNRNLAL